MAAKTMTLSRIHRIIFRANFRRYMLLFLCGSFAITVFFAFATLYQNARLLISLGSDRSILYAPALVIGVFSCFFMMYAHNSYARYRLKDFGILLTLGMPKQQMWRLILVESGLISVLSLCAGIAAGTVFSKPFVFALSLVLQTRGITISLPWESYLYTLIFFSVIFILNILGTIFAIAKLEIVAILKLSRKEATNRTSRPVFAAIGAILLVAPALYMLLSSAENLSTTLTVSAAVCLIGLYLLLSNLTWLMAKLSQVLHWKRYRNLLLKTSLQHSFGQTKNVIFVTALLVGITVFFAGLCSLILSDTERTAIGYHPFDLAYAQFDDTGDMPSSVLETAIRQGKTHLVSKGSIEFVRGAGSGGFIVISDRDLNAVSGTRYEVQRGQFISLLQVMTDDNHAHDEVSSSHPSQIVIQKIQFMSQGQENRILFNNVASLVNGRPLYLIVNAEDFLLIRSKSRDLRESGHLVLLRFENWRQTKEISDALTAGLLIYFNVPAENADGGQDPRASSWGTAYYAPSSRIQFFEQARLSIGFTLFLFSCAGVLFFLASPLLLHFKLLTDYEAERAKYARLFKLGITRQDVQHLVDGEMRILFFMPFITGAALAFFFNSALPVIIGDTAMAFRISAIIIVAYGLFQAVCCKLYCVVYGRKLLRDIGLLARAKRIRSRGLRQEA